MILSPLEKISSTSQTTSADHFLKSFSSTRLLHGAVSDTLMVKRSHLWRTICYYRMGSMYRLIWSGLLLILFVYVYMWATGSMRTYNLAITIKQCLAHAQKRTYLSYYFLARQCNAIACTGTCLCNIRGQRYIFRVLPVTGESRGNLARWLHNF